MNENEKLKTLADLLAKVAGISVDEEDDPVEVISKATEKLQKKKAVDDEFVDDLKDADAIQDDDEKVVSEDLDDPEPNKHTRTYEEDWFEWIVKKLNGKGLSDSNKWYGTIFDFGKIGNETPSIRDDIETADTDEDEKEGITFDDIQEYFDGIDPEDFATLYLPKDFDFSEKNIDKALDDLASDLEDDEDDEEGYELDADIDEFPWDEHLDSEGRLLHEALTLQQRMARKIIMKRIAKKVAFKRKLALKRHANAEVLEKRARKLAIRMLKKKFSGGKDSDEMSFGERKRVEDILDSKKPLIDRLQKKMMPVVRKIEKERFEKKDDE